jgi:hypothetical protein
MKPRAFRIRDFKSIEDSGVCVLSGDSITVLAGQNEAGKTAILTALRDFDLEEEAAPDTMDYQPEERPGAKPVVSVQFEANPTLILRDLDEEKLRIPLAVKQRLSKNRIFWITRDLQSGRYTLEEEFAMLWAAANAASDTQPEQNANSESQESGTAKRLLQPEEFAAWHERCGQALSILTHSKIPFRDRLTFYNLSHQSHQPRPRDRRAQPR